MLERLETLKVTVGDGFYVLIIPNGDCYDFLLSHEEYGVFEHVFGCKVENKDDAVELALGNIENGNYIESYIEEYFD